MKNNELYFTLTMHIAYGFLEKGTISPDEFSTFLDEMQDKYACEKVRILYQSKLDILREQSVNVDTKGGD